MNVDVTANGMVVHNLGHYLRASLDSNLVVLASATGQIVGGTGGIGGWVGDTGVAVASPGSFAGLLRSAGVPTFVLDRRSGEREPAVSSALAKPWHLMFEPGAPYETIVPHTAFDGIAYFDRVTPAKLIANY